MSAAGPLAVLKELPTPYVLTLLAVFSYLLYLQVTRRSHLRLPPGPRGLPFIGNALQIPPERAWVTFAKWSETYGGIMHLSALGKPTIVLSSPEIVNELLEKRSAIYSDRPVQTMTSELMGYGPFLPVCAYGSWHREGRRIMAGALSASKMADIRQLQMQKTSRLLTKLLNNPEDLWSHMRWFIASISFGVSHGYNVESLEDPLVRLAERANLEYCLAAVPGAFLVDVIPALQYVPDWFPGAGWKQKLKAWRGTTDRLRDEPFEYVKEQVAKGTAQPSVTASLIEENPNRSEEEERLFRYMSSSIYSAGADTTVSAIESFFMAMMLYPEVQRKAQLELDTVLGPGHIANWDDLHRLTYIQALIYEIYRWNPVAPIALPHRVTQDDVYEGCHIPAGATIVVNNWAILHDAALYPEPFEFKPERYLDSKATGLNPDPRQFAFGYGRRVCPGKTLAEDSVFIAVTSTLALFEISKVLDANGAPIEPDSTFDGFISHPPRFSARVTPRFPNVERMIPAA